MRKQLKQAFQRRPLDRISFSFLLCDSCGAGQAVFQKRHLPADFPGADLRHLAPGHVDIDLAFRQQVHHFILLSLLDEGFAL